VLAGAADYDDRPKKTALAIRINWIDELKALFAKGFSEDAPTCANKIRARRLNIAFRLEDGK
jgi:hypothetical protein